MRTLKRILVIRDFEHHRAIMCFINISTLIFTSNNHVFVCEIWPLKTHRFLVSLNLNVAGHLIFWYR